MNFRSGAPSMEGMRSSLSFVFFLVVGSGCKSPEQPSATPYVGKTAQRLQLEDFIGRLASAIELSGDEVANEGEQIIPTVTNEAWPSRRSGKWLE